MSTVYSPPGRWIDPVREMQRTQESLNSLFGRLRAAPRKEFLLVNIWANAEGAIVTAEVPGVRPEDLDIAVHQDTVTLRGTRSSEPIGENAVIHRQERIHGAFARALTLPFRIDADRVAARFHLGVLTLELPRPAVDKPHKIQVVRS